jgi:hypothetical protein
MKLFLIALLLLNSLLAFAEQEQYCTASSPSIDLTFESETLQGVIERCASLTMDRSGCRKSAECELLEVVCTASAPNIDLTFESGTLRGVIDRCASFTMDRTGCRKSAVCSYQ